MKKTIIVLLTFYSISAFSQVGINTKKPQTPLHIDAKGDTENTTHTSDDVVVDANGNLGIGTISPTKKLDVNGNSIVSGDDVVKGNLNAKTISAQDGIRVGKNDLTDAQDYLEIYGNGSGTGLKLQNEDQTNDTDLRYVPVMTQKNNDGVLGWTNLPMVTTTVEGTVSGAISSNWSNVTSEIELNEPGYWIVFISFTAHTNTVGPANNNRSNIFLQLVNTVTGSEITRGASSTESNGFRVGAVQYMHVLKVNSAITIRGRAKCNFNTSVRTDLWGDPKFYAIKIN